MSPIRPLLFWRPVCESRRAVLMEAEIISTIVWIIDLIFFTLISLTFLSRCIKHPSATVKMFETDVEQTTYLSTTSIAAATIVELLALICGSRWNNWQYASFALWWAVVLLSVTSATTTYWLLVRDEKVAIDNLTPTLLYPTTGLLATATAGSVVVGYTPLSITLSMPVIVVSYLLLGAGESITRFWRWACRWGGWDAYSRVLFESFDHVGVLSSTIAQPNPRAEKGRNAINTSRTVLQCRVFFCHSGVFGWDQETCV